MSQTVGFYTQLHILSSMMVSLFAKLFRRKLGIWQFRGLPATPSIIHNFYACFLSGVAFLSPPVFKFPISESLTGRFSRQLLVAATARRSVSRASSGPGVGVRP